MRTSPLAFLLVCALLPVPGLNASSLSGEEEGNFSSPLPRAPESRILDAARVFTFEKAIHDELSARLSDASSVHGLDIYIAAYSFLLDETIESRANRLAEQWLVHPKGLVIVYVRGGSKITFAAAKGAEEFLPSSELEELFTIAAMSAKKFDDPAPRLKAAAEQLIQSIIERREVQEEQQSLLRRDVLLLALGAGVLVFLVARLGLILFCIDRRPGAARLFPFTQVGCRFGAPHGGGVLTEVSFASTSPETEEPQPPGNPLP